MCIRDSLYAVVVAVLIVKVEVGGEVLCDLRVLDVLADQVDVYTRQAMLCFDRLRYPWQLSETAAGHYRAFLAANTGWVLTRLLKAQDLDGIRALLALDVLDKDSFAEAAALAAKAESAAAAALLADAEHKKYAAEKKKARYDFDF